MSAAELPDSAKHPIAQSVQADHAEFNAYLEEARAADLSDLERAGCVSDGLDNKNCHIIIMIPMLGLNHAEKPEVSFRRMLLLFIRRAHEFVGKSYSIVYAHCSIDLMNQYPLIYKFYSILPRSYKKNLQKMYIVHPNNGIKMFFEFARVFLSHKFYSKLLLLDSIMDFQKLIPPTQISLPLKFVRKEDEESGLKYYNQFASLKDSFIPTLGTTQLLQICSEFILRHGGRDFKGIFRVAGNEGELIVAKCRLQYSCVGPNKSNRIILSENKEYLIIGDLDSITNFKASNPRASMAIGGDRSSKRVNNDNAAINKRGSINMTFSSGAAAAVASGDASKAVEEMPPEVPTSCIIIRDVNTVAQILKLSLRDLPEPLVPNDTYNALVASYRKWLNADRVSVNAMWHDQAASLLAMMPLQHLSVLCFVVK